MIAPRSFVYADNGTAICTAQTDSSQNIGTCINRIYIISLSAGGVIAVLIFVIAGYLYMSGGDGVGRAKTMIISAITGLVILFSAFLFLNTINPDLTSFTGLTLPNIVCGTTNSICAAPTSSLSGTNGITAVSPGNGTIGSCKPATSAPGDPTDLQAVFGANATNASEIIQAESSNNPGSKGDLCQDGNAASIGLFQINMTANPIPASINNGVALTCSNAFQGVASGSSYNQSTQRFACTVTNPTLYNQCVAALVNPTINEQLAYQLLEQRDKLVQMVDAYVVRIIRTKP